MRLPAAALACVWASLSGSCSPAACVLQGYDLGSPVFDQQLPAALREVSGLVATGGADELVAVQDERGEVHRLVLGGKPQRVKFGGPGDYEAIACDGGRLWVLRSDGKLMRLAEHRSRYRVEAERKLELSGTEFESLCWDPVRGVLLVAPKEQSGSLANRGMPLVIHAVDGDSLQVRPDQRVVLQPDARLEGERIRLSELVVHPTTGAIWLLDGPRRRLWVVDRNGVLLGVQELPGSGMPQPEALTFFADGRLVIASEGRPARLRVFGRLQE
jgi:uncharacterized protein YjiK